MKIEEIFKKDISRPINGVVKADQLNESVVWQELEEYVITRELGKHFRTFLTAYIAGMENPHDPTITEKMGVWVSGFFGSGKSHFIKILSYLLANRETVHPETGEKKRAIDFFSGKINDPMFLGDMRRIARADTDILLFNIDSKADAGKEHATIVSVFWRVLNEDQGFCGEPLHLGEMERYLYRKGKFDDFKIAFRDVYGSDWESERDAYSLIKEKIVEALSVVLDISKADTNEWFEKLESEFTLTVEKFAMRVKEYLDSKSPDQRIVFLVDEIGQFIGSDTRLMLNLQTIVEDLGRICNGRAWVIVTSQEDIDAVIGEVRGSRANDFSKIQGRFNTRLSLSSSNTDEVIQVRLLEKTPAAKQTLETLFQEKGDIVKNQLSFTSDSSALKTYADSADFVGNYPFVPYHFQLLQKIFESIRKAGATGLHLSRGERSMLDAFQLAATSISGQPVGTLAPLYDFYPCIESFLDTAVKRSIDQARDNAHLEVPFDVTILQTLFLIRYVDILKPNIDNLVTLCIRETDTDRLALKKKIEKALERLEKQNLINRNGELFFFLTNEEREVSREIKNVEIYQAKEIELLSTILFDDILKGKKKHRYAEYKRDYPFTRICDGHYLDRETGDLALEIVSPLHDEYDMYGPEKCCMYTANEQGTVLVKLGDDPDMFSEIRAFLQTEKYIRDKSDASTSPGLKAILKDRAEQNRQRRKRLMEMLERRFTEAEFYALGKSLKIQGQTPVRVLEEAFDHLVQNVYSKFHYLTKIYEDPVGEIRETLRADDFGQQQLLLDLETNPHPATEEIKRHIDLRLQKDPPVILKDLTGFFAKKPFGWDEYQTVVRVARLFIEGDISLIVNVEKLDPAQAVTPLTQVRQWNNIRIVKRKIPSQKDIEDARKLGKEVFAAIAPEGLDNLAGYIRNRLDGWKQLLSGFKPLADTGNYPGKREIDECLELAGKLLSIQDPYELIKAFNEKKEDLEDVSGDIADLKDFYENQRPTWETLREALNKFEPNFAILKKRPETNKALLRLTEIKKAPNPYGMLKEVNNLVSAIEAVNKDIVAEKGESAVHQVEEKITGLFELLEKHKADEDLKNRMLSPLQDIRKQIRNEYRIPHIEHNVTEAREIYKDRMEEIDALFTGEKEKEVVVVKPAEMKQKAFLDTEDDVDEYIGRLRKRLIDAIAENNRVMIE